MSATIYPNDAFTTGAPDPGAIRPVDVALASVCYTFAICGTSANVLVIVVISSQRALRKPTHLYVLCLAVLDCTMSAFIMPFQGTAVLTGESIKGCDIVGSTQLALRMAIIGTLTAIAVNRFMAVFLSLPQYRSAYTPVSVGVSIVIIVVMALASLLPIWLGLYDPGYRENVGFCVATIQSDTFTKGYAITVVYTCLYGIPSAVIIVCCYVGVWRRFRRSACVVYAAQLPTATSQQPKTCRLTRTLFILTAVYALCWGPGYVVNILDYYYDIPTPLLKAVDVLCFTSSVLNPVLYSMMNQQFTSVIRAFLRRCRCCRCCQSTVSPQQQGKRDAGEVNNCEDDTIIEP